LRLAERAAQWNVKPENRYLPKWWEHLSIRLFTRKKNWDDRARKMMRRSGRVHGRHASAAALLLVTAWAGYLDSATFHFVLIVSHEEVIVYWAACAR